MTRIPGPDIVVHLLVYKLSYHLYLSATTATG